MPVTEHTAETIKPFLDERYAEVAADARAGIYQQFNRWLDRGDGLAIYENHDLGHPELGHIKIVSYGSQTALLETGTPPERLPDIGVDINWRYQLIGTYRGPVLPA